jgi:hypothetical protein
MVNKFAQLLPRSNSTETYPGGGESSTQNFVKRWNPPFSLLSDLRANIGYYPPSPSSSALHNSNFRELKWKGGVLSENTGEGGGNQNQKTLIHTDKHSSFASRNQNIRSTYFFWVYFFSRVLQLFCWRFEERTLKKCIINELMLSSAVSLSHSPPHSPLWVRRKLLWSIKIFSINSSMKSRLYLSRLWHRFQHVRYRNDGLNYTNRTKTQSRNETCVCVALLTIPGVKLCLRRTKLPEAQPIVRVQSNHGLQSTITTHTRKIRRFVQFVTLFCSFA